MFDISYCELYSYKKWDICGKNIYLDKKSVRLFFIPIPYYKINIVYVSDNDKVNILAFPTIMLNKKDVYDLFSCFEVKEYKIPNDKIKKHK